MRKHLADRPRADRLMAFTAGAVVIVIVFLIMTAVLEAQRKGRQALEKLQTQQMDQLTRGLDTRISSALVAIAGITNGLDAKKLDELQALNPDARSGLLIVDGAGTIVHGTHLLRPVTGQKLDRPDLAETLASGDAGILPVAPGVTAAGPTLALIVPIADSGQFLVAESEVGPESDFNHEVAQLASGSTGEFSIVDSRGIVVASTNGGSLGQPLPHGDNARALGLHRVDGQVVAVAEVKSAQWRAVFRQNAAEFDGGLASGLRWALILLVVMAVVGGGCAFVVVLRRLATAREEHRRLAEVSKAREEFISIVSHELRTPVTAVMGFLEVTLDNWGSMTEDERRSALERACGGARRLHLLTRDVLDTASLESGQLTYSFEDVDLRDEVGVSVAAILDGQPGSSIRYEPPSQPVWARVDRTRIHQVVANLLDNALKNSPSGSIIEVSLSTKHDEVRLAVSDYGSGMSEEQLTKVFGKFVRGRRSTSRGTGLGLYICERIVEAHGGRIWAENRRAPAGVTHTPAGATFTVALPLSKSPSLVSSHH